VLHELPRPTFNALGLAGPSRVTYRAAVTNLSKPEQLVEQAIPAISLPSSAGGKFDLRSRVGVGPLVLFFYIYNGTPG
jgi:hypothetical protein